MGVLNYVSVIRDRASWNQSLALVGSLIDQFSILTKASDYVFMAHSNITLHKHTNFIYFSLS